MILLKKKPFNDSIFYLCSNLNLGLMQVFLFQQVPTMSEMIDMWKNKKMNTFGILYSWFLAKACQLLQTTLSILNVVEFDKALHIPSSRSLSLNLSNLNMGLVTFMG